MREGQVAARGSGVRPSRVGGGEEPALRGILARAGVACGVQGPGLGDRLRRGRGDA